MKTLVEGSPSSDCTGAWIVADSGAGVREAMGRAMESCRQYLLLVADHELDAGLRAKGGASDLVQETFLEAHADILRFRGRTEGELRAWLRRILLNNLANFRRQYRATSKRQIAIEFSIDDPGGLGRPTCNMVSAEASPSHHAAWSEQVHALARGLERLPENYRCVILWRHQQQNSFDEIGQRLGTSSDAARMVWARAIKRLQQEIKGCAKEA